MDIKQFITIVIIIFTSHIVYGQSETLANDKALLISLGVDHISLKDRTFSPTVFSGNVPSLGFGFSKNIRDEKIWNLSLSASIGNIDYENKYFSTNYIGALFIFNYTWKIKSFGQSKLFFGGQFRSIVNILDYEGFASGSWYTGQQLEPLLRYTYTISERQSISGQFSYPVAGLSGRPPYGGVDEFLVVNTEKIPKILYSRLKFQTIHQLINPDFTVRYTYELKKVSFSWSLNYSYLQVNSVRRYAKNNLGFNVNFHLKIGKKNEN